MTDEERQQAAEALAEQHDREEEWPSGAQWTGKPIELETLWYDAASDPHE